MAPAPCIHLPCTDPDELRTLRRLEALLEDCPYMRADLRATSPASKELEQILSVRLAWLHTEGLRRNRKGASLLAKLWKREEELAQAMAHEDDEGAARLRYETLLLLHPEPGKKSRTETGSTRLAAAIARWEHERQRRPTRMVFMEKCKQSRDFFRHGAMLPFYWVRRRRIRARLPRVVLDKTALRETFFAIEQIGPLVDNFAFGGALGIPTSTAVALADVTFLYMQLADEFLDELAAAMGGHDAAGRLLRTLYRDDADRPLRELSLDHVRAIGIEPEHLATRFDLSLSQLFAVLEELGRTIDDLVAQAAPSVVGATRRFLHHCFQTYLDEACLGERASCNRADRMPLEDAAWHFYRKNNMVMMLWLDLRARLVGLDPARHAEAIRRWGYLLASFQIFDDLKDVAIDLGKQPNYALQIAAHDFPHELAWIEERFGSRRAPISRDEVAEMSLGARKTVQQCMKWSRFIALAHFDNVLLYAWDQRWRKSWTQRRRSFNPEGEVSDETDDHAVDRIMAALLAIRKSDESGEVDDEQLAFALDAAAYESSWQIHLALFPNLRAMYRFATLRMWMTSEEKALAARRLLRRFARTRATRSIGLGDLDVDHQIAGDGLEALSKVIEA